MTEAYRQQNGRVSFNVVKGLIMRSNPEYILVLIVVLVVTYLVITPIAHKAAKQMNDTALLIEGN